MKTIQFGTDQVGVETPPQIKLIYRWLMFISAIWFMAIDPRLPDLSEHIKYVIASWIGGGNIAIYAFCNCFGYKCPDNIPAVAIPPIPAIAQPEKVIAQVVTEPEKLKD